MELIEFTAKLKHLEYSQTKYHVDGLGEYAQLVFKRRNMPQWMQTIENILGPPVKTDEQLVTEDVVRLTEEFGEIFDHQTLYYREIEGQRIMAMFWPWKNEDAITLKIMIMKREI